MQSPSLNGSRSEWKKPCAASSDLRAESALRRRLAERLAEVPCDLIYPVILCASCCLNMDESLERSIDCPGYACLAC